MGLPLIVDQGFCKIYEITAQSYVGLVDAEHGTHKPNAAKPVILSFVTPQVDEWYTYLLAQGVPMLHPLGTSEKIGVRGFMALDPEGYTLEFEHFLSQPRNEAMLAQLSKR